MKRKRKSHCRNCLMVNRQELGPHWGRHVEEIDSCLSCVHRYETKSKLDLNNQRAEYENSLVQVKREHQQQINDHKAALAAVKAKSELELIEQKVEYEKKAQEEQAVCKAAAVAALEAKRELESAKRELESVKQNLDHDVALLKMNQLQAEYNTEHCKAKFLKIPREDYLPGDVILDSYEFDADGRVEVGVHPPVVAHQSIVAARSRVFRNIIESGTHTQEKRTGLVYIKMDVVSHPVKEAVISFCYTGEISFSETVPPHEVLKVAHKYEIKLLRDVCESELCRRISIENLPRMLKLSRTFGARGLQDEAGKFFKEHFDDLKDRVYETLEETIDT